MKKWLSCLLTLTVLALAAAPHYSFQCERSPKNGFAQPGETVRFTVALLADRQKCDLPFTTSLTVEGRTPEKQQGNGRITVETVAPEHGFIYISASYQPEGAARPVSPPWSDAVAVAPEKIRPGMAEPADFDDFWRAARAELAAVPLQEEALTPVPVKEARYADKVDCFQFRLAAPGGRQAFGYLTLPKNAAKGTLPGLIRFDGAGIYVHQPEYRAAADGFLAVSVNAHGVEPGRSENDLLDRLKKERYYSSVGWEEVKTTAFYPMLLRDLRALEFLKSRPEWNGKTLVSFGASQGGAQSLAIAALAPEITFCYAGVPGWCNHGGADAKQVRGWPGNFPWNAQSRKAAGYLDNCFFARRLKCPVLVSAAWHDFLTRPSTVYAAYNNIAAPKELRPFPHASHGAAIRELEEYARQQANQYGKTK